MVANWNAQTQEAEEQEPCECEKRATHWDAVTLIKSIPLEQHKNKDLKKLKLTDFEYDVYQCDFCDAIYKYKIIF